MKCSIDVAQTLGFLRKEPTFLRTLDRVTASPSSKAALLRWQSGCCLKDGSYDLSFHSLKFPQAPHPTAFPLSKHGKDSPHSF